jgi:hypothetical protein
MGIFTLQLPAFFFFPCQVYFIHEISQCVSKKSNLKFYACDRSRMREGMERMEKGRYQLQEKLKR